MAGGTSVDASRFPAATQSGAVRRVRAERPGAGVRGGVAARVDDGQLPVRDVRRLGDHRQRRVAPSPSASRSSSRGPSAGR